MIAGPVARRKGVACRRSSTVFDPTR